MNKQDLEIAKAALEVSAWQIYTKSWKVRIQKVLDALRAGETPPAPEMDFALTVTYEGRTTYCGKQMEGSAWDAMVACKPVRDKARASKLAVAA